MPVAVIGAGPVGLAAAAHLAERGVPFVVFEAGEGAAAAVRQWGHVTFFSPWRFNVDSAAERLLKQTGWVMPDPDRDPTGQELIDNYLAPLAALPAIAPHIRYGARVTAVTRQGMDRVPSKGREQRPFEISVTHADGTVERVLASAVIDASGTWSAPNPAGANGIPALGEKESASRISYGNSRCVRERAQTLCRKARGGDRLRPFGDGFDFESGALEERGAGNGNHLGHAFAAHGQDLWRRGGGSACKSRGAWARGPRPRFPPAMFRWKRHSACRVLRFTKNAIEITDETGKETHRR